MDLGLSGRTVVITGGTSGIGLAAAGIFLDEGARVAICGRNAERLDKVAADLCDRFGAANVLARRCDVTKQDDVAAFARDVEAWSGRVDILINNAGQGQMTTFASTTDEQWRHELDLKFFSQIYPVRAFQALLEKSDAAAILAVNSLLAYQPEPYMVATSAARAGVQSLVKSLATEFAPRIRVNSVVLGLIDSGQWERRFQARENKAQSRDEWIEVLAKSKHIPFGRLGNPAEVARAIVFLASPAASYVTGSALEISGGISRFI
ncbi:SDR family oxidoreductase [Roseiarcaceae bacterium H3SJ34-1]|uniref:SDR family oxidoreductase n=1 Tax=Terripilifer ovatus TaxID=3032367 RepID=UPI003AB979AF|nr:SDR family oxidoreductase [Roseiarcaceae bacterium H3SJ34-1]